MLAPFGQRLARSLGHGRAAGLAVVLLGVVGTLIYADAVGSIYPIRLWLFWKMAMLWGWTTLFSLACLSLGQAVLVRVLKVRERPALESAVFSITIGVVAFALAMYLGGALGWYARWFGVALPLAMLAIGARDGWPLLRQLHRELTSPLSASLLELAIGAAGVLCVGVVYLGAFTPDSLNYDSTWSHLVVAQDYANAGRIIPFPADYNKNVPQLASLLYTWGYLVPGFSPYPALRWMMALHLELSLFLWTLVSVAALIRHLVPDLTLRRAWVSFFLFPIIFVHDNNLGGAADHVCGFFAVPAAFAALRLWEDFRHANATLIAIACGGGLLTKYQAVFFIAPIAVLVATAWLLRLNQLRLARRGTATAPAEPLREVLTVPLVIAGLGLVLLSPHLLRQLIFHHNPVYPFGQDVFPSTPTVPNASLLMANALADPNYQPSGTLWDKLVHGVQLSLTFSFRPHYSFTNDVPSFGSLFTLLLPAALLVRERKRLLLAAALASGAVLAWAMIYHIDRNLQVFMPLLVAVTGAIVVKAWRLGGWARCGLVPLIAFQIVWGADAPFYSGWDRIQSAMNLIRSGYESQARKRFRDYRRSFLDMRRALPRDARVLLHSAHISLGIERQIFLDNAGFQGMFDYAGLRTPRELYDFYKAHGITHLLYEPHGYPAPSRHEDVIFKALAEGHADFIGEYGEHRLFALPLQPPPVEPPYQVATLGLGGYDDGSYPVETMNTFQHLPKKLQHFAKPARRMPIPADERAQLLAEADAVLVAPKQTLDRQLTLVLQREFRSVFKNEDELELFLKKSHIAPSRKSVDVRSSRPRPAAP
jgi:hypothetical protein